MEIAFAKKQVLKYSYPEMYYFVQNCNFRQVLCIEVTQEVILMSRDNFGHNFSEYRQRAKSTGQLYQIDNSGGIFEDPGDNLGDDSGDIFL